MPSEPQRAHLRPSIKRKFSTEFSERRGFSIIRFLSLVKIRGGKGRILGTLFVDGLLGILITVKIFQSVIFL